MTLQDFTPENGFEDAIQDVKRGRLSFETMFEVMADANLLIPSKTEVLADFTGFKPLLLEKDGDPYVAAFTSLNRPALFGEAAAYVLQINGREFFLRIPPEYGVMLNPGYNVQIAIPRETVGEIKQTFTTR